MTCQTLAGLDTSGRRIATRVVFFIAGFAMGAWAPLVPYAQQRLHLDANMLGILLLCLGSGSLVTLLVSGRLAEKFGCRALIVSGIIMACLALPLLATTPSLAVMAAALMLFGAGVGLMDVTVNIQGTIVEQAAAVPLMSGFHCAFSVGGLSGAAAGSLALSLGMTPLWMVILAATLMLVLIISAVQQLFPFANHETAVDAPFRLNLRLLIMGAMCLVCFLAEGAVLDWSGIWLTTRQGISLDHAGWGYAAFGLAMAVMRFCGDRMVRLFGRRRLLVLSGLVAISGYLLAVLVSGWQFSLLGFVLVGLGAANVVPLVTSIAGKETIVPPNISVAFVSTVGYLGILMGPALLGFITQLAGLSFAFMCIAVLLWLVVVGAVKVTQNSR